MSVYDIELKMDYKNNHALNGPDHAIVEAEDRDSALFLAGVLVGIDTGRPRNYVGTESMSFLRENLRVLSVSQQ